MIMQELIKEYQDFLNEAKTMGLSFEEFSKVRLDGAAKIAEAAKAKGGAALLTYQHFNVKLPYYKKAAAGKFNLAEMQKELTTLVKDLARGTSGKIKLEQVEFQRLVGKIEVVGELLIRHKDK
jgi:DNA-binding ferritin-like protein